MKAKVVVALTLLTSLPLSIFAKGFNDQFIKGSLKATDGAAVPFATIALRKSNDSTLVKGELSDDNGAFIFEQVKEGNYYIEVQSIGFEMHVKGDILVEPGKGVDLGVISLKSTGNTLQTVNVAADKPFIERQIDRTVVNIENSIIQINTSVIEVMEKLPGVLVNQEGVISLKGKQGVIITIDGKPTGLGGQELGNLLRGMPSSSIQKIEIITNPSSKHDAAGNAGIINIVTKKNRKPGFNGSISAGYGQGRYEKYNTAINLSYKNKWYNLFLNYSYAHRKGFNNLRLTRNFYANDTLNTVFQTNNYILFPFNTHNPRAGADFTLSKKTSLSLMASGVMNKFSPSADNHTDILNGDMVKVSSYDFRNRSHDTWYNYSLNSQLKHVLDTSGREFTIDLDYAKYVNEADQEFTTTVNDADANFLAQSVLIGDQNADLAIHSIKGDYIHPLSRSSKFETGFKSSYVTGESDIRFYNQTVETMMYDSSRSNHFLYSEIINAAYLNLSKEFKKLSTQFGVRMEHTNADGVQLITGQAFDRNYVQVFPTIFLDFKVNEKNSVNLNAGRRIDRPGYQQMNPFRRMIDATTYGEGNPYLLPQLTYNTELTYSYANALFATIGYSKTLDNITDMLIQDSEKRITVQTVVNLDEFDYYSANITYSKRLTPWWNTNTSILSFYGLYQGVINNYAINQGTPSFYFNTGNSFTIMEGLSMECNFQYSHKNLYGVTLMKENYNLSLGIQKSFLNKKATLTLNVSDLFWRAWPSGVTEFGNVNETWSSRRDTRVVNVNLSYRFGKGQTARMRRNTGADEEKRRAGVGS